MNMVRDVMKPFVQEICEDVNTVIEVVLFNRHTERFSIPRNRESAGRLITDRVNARGGTDFHEASKGMVSAASRLLRQHPAHQLTVIMCSDGEVRKDNAERGHAHWKQFVNSQYLAVHRIAPNVETIGISSEHDADILNGFIVNDDCGNYVRCADSAAIRQAFENAQNTTMVRTKMTKISIEFTMLVHNGTQIQENGSKQFDVIAVGDAFSATFWVDVDSADVKRNEDENFLTVNGDRVDIEEEQVTDEAQFQYEAIEFYDALLKNMYEVFISFCALTH